MYNWCVAAAGKPHATWTLGTVSFVESSFFPIPPDAMLLPMSLARPDRAYYFAIVCTLDVGRRRHPRLCDRLFPLRVARAVADAALRLRRQDRMVPAAVPRMGRLVHPDQGPDADPLQARDHRVGLRPISDPAVHPVVAHHARRALLSPWRSCATATAIARARSSRSVWSCGPPSSRSCWWSELSQRSTCFEPGSAGSHRSESHFRHVRGLVKCCGTEVAPGGRQANVLRFDTHNDAASRSAFGNAPDAAARWRRWRAA